MLRLETVEDFERVDKALSDPGSSLSEYCVMNYGYCGFCKSLCVFDFISEPYHIHCRGCEHDFYPDHLGLSYLYMISLGSPDYPEPAQVFEFKLGKDIPKQQQKVSINRRQFSRSYQRMVFDDILKSRIRELKREQRSLAGKIRRLAKLRP
ncbi:MAG: hypothetical protein HY505_02730 [Candidatus Yanofskybacteria bacterium]|nr:hypothetical protein [Candidatus Yanofskybacteria bacterium]